MPTYSSIRSEIQLSFYHETPGLKKTRRTKILYLKILREIGLKTVKYQVSDFQ